MITTLFYKSKNLDKYFLLSDN